MTLSKLQKAIKECKEAVSAVKDLIVTKLISIKISICFTISSIMLAIYDTCRSIMSAIYDIMLKIISECKKVLANISKGIRFIAYHICNYTLRYAGATLKFPVYILNNISIVGNILQMRANHFKAKAKGVYIPIGKVINRDLPVDE